MNELKNEYMNDNYKFEKNERQKSIVKNIDRFKDILSNKVYNITNISNKNNIIENTTHQNIIKNKIEKNNFYKIPDVLYKFESNDLNIETMNANLKPYINQSLHKYLSQSKDLICGNENIWDNMKKITNPYEYIHSTYNGMKCISKLKPLSRAYYKFIEILKIFDLLPTNKYTCIQSFHLAEGPGGFIEALLEKRNNNFDIYYGMTLQDNNNQSVPGWKKGKEYMKKHNNIILENGLTGDGDLYKSKNFKYLYETFNNTMDIITGDGGFDFSIDYIKQEQQAVRLIMTEIFYALSLQKKGGCFVLKIFDVFTKPSVQLLFFLRTFYKEVYIYKPYTSRIANSEKYLVCKNFCYNNIDFIYPKLYNILYSLEKQYNENSDLVIQSILNKKIHCNFKTSLTEINSIYGQQQIENIHYTFILIQSNNNKKKEKIENMKKNNIMKCINWCNYFNIPYSEYKKSNMFL